MDGVVPKNDQKNESDVKKVAMQVLQDQRKAVSPRTCARGFTNRACGRIEKERSVVGFAVVVTMARNPAVRRGSIALVKVATSLS